MIAMFIGEDKSMGFRQGKTYRIRSELKVVDNKAYIYIYDMDSKLWCPYSSLESVRRNWTI